ncbi:MAG: helix-turn-helix domain-containing protein [Chloroflexota bacterium]|nr:helix-turn-helix domain-containing protein [Chloroflexota bacterium]
MKRTEEVISANERLREARKIRGWTQSDLAEKLGTTPLAVSRWESGGVFPHPHFRKKLCELFDKSPHELGLVREGGEDEDPVRPGSLFPFNEPLLNAEELYGRRRESHKAFDRIYHKASTSIVGARRIGKTWFLKYLRLTADKELGARFHIGYLDAMLPSCWTVAGFAAEALKQLGRAPAPGRCTGLLDLQEGIEALAVKRLIPVLCIDRFESFTRDSQEFGFDFYHGLRALAQVADFVLVVTSKKPLYEVVGREGETSGFCNIFEQVMLAPFSVGETEQFIHEKSLKAGFTTEECDYLWRYGREGKEDLWLPVRLQLAGKLLLEEKEQNPAAPLHRSRFEQHFADAYQGMGS